MSGLDEIQALTTSIGEFSLDTIGKSKLRGLRVTLDPRSLNAEMVIVLKKNTDSQQKSVLRSLFEVERVFADDAVLSYHFADDLVDDEATLGMVPLFSYA
jgi:hypothetical protein